jgi:PAS domain S-box-containing protein
VVTVVRRGIVQLPAVLVTALVLSGGYVALSGYVWQHRVIRGARELTALGLAVATWALFYALELGTQDVGWSRLWNSLEYLGVVSLPPCLWAFVASYLGWEAQRPRAWLLFMVEPGVLLTLLAVPATHDLIMVYGPAPRRIDGVPVPDPGPLFWPHAIYSYGLLIAALVVLVARLLQVASPYRRQAYALIVAAVLPLVGNLLYTFRLFGLLIDPTPFLFLVTAVVFVWGLLRQRLLDVPAVTRNVVVEQLADGVLLLDLWSRIVDANPASAALVGTRRAALIGCQLDDVLPTLANAVRTCADGAVTDLASPVRIMARPGLSSSASELDLSVSVTGLVDHAGRPTARIVVMRDVTERIRNLHRMRELLEERTAVVETIEQSLRPSTLPTVPGLTITARWIPAGGGAAVSGDFYDVHPTGDGGWAFVLGDVSGKGVRAAVLTSLVRHTVRTLSAQCHPPHTVLERLNDALLTGNDPEQFCTVAYGSIHRASSAQAGGLGVRITLALGGHPMPLRRRCCGEVTAVGAPGTALGLLEDVEVTDTEVDLAPGEVLLLYTDGVTEARRGSEWFGEERLARTLDEAVRAVEGSPRPGAASCPAARVDEIADLVVQRVREFTKAADDVAVLVLTAT